MIALNSVSKEVGKGRFRRRIIDDVTWTIQPRSRIVVLGHRIAGSQLLRLIAGLSLPNEGWVERRGSISVPGGFLGYGRTTTTRKLIDRLSPIYNMDSREVAEFIEIALENHHVLDTPILQVPLSLKKELNVALTYAIPCDFYLFDGAVGSGRRPEFRAFCEKAFNLRCRTSGVILATHSSRAASSLTGFSMGAVLYGGSLTLYSRVDDAIAVFNSLPPEQEIPKQAAEEEEAEESEMDIL